MAKDSGYEPRLYLEDDDGNYYVQVAGAKAPIPIPEDQRSEVEAALRDEDERVGALFLGDFDLTPQVRVERELTTLGACRGECGRTFGVLRDSKTARLFLQDEDGDFYVQAKGMRQPIRVPDDKRQEVEDIIGGKNERAGFVAIEAFPQRVSVQLKTLGACRGTCGRSFGVL